MPTAYTANVGDGKTTDFTEFALSCARAFGGLITMRDDPMDAPIPDEFAPSDYNATALREAEAALQKIMSMSEDEKVAAAAENVAENVAGWDAREAGKKEAQSRYETMLSKVRDWTPPTDEHEGLKTFMLEQLCESIDFDCGPAYDKRPEPVPVGDWYADALAKANRNVSYHAKAQAEEIERARKRTKWVAALRASLALKPAQAA